MSRPKRNYVAILPDATEHPFELADDADRHHFQSALEGIVSRAGIVADRDEPLWIKVQCAELRIRGKELVRLPCTIHEVMPPFAQMTAEEFLLAQSAAIAEIPAEFHNNVTNEAFQRSDSTGLEERLGELRTLIAMIREPIEAYTRRIVATVAPAAPPVASLALLARPVDFLELKGSCRLRVRKGMAWAGVQTLGELIRKTPHEFMQRKNFGVGALNELRRALAEHGLHLKGDKPL